MPFGGSEVLPLLPAQKALTIDTMSFFENGGFLDDDIPSFTVEEQMEAEGEGAEGSAPDRDTHMDERGMKKKDTQRTRPPSRSTSGSSGSTPKRPYLPSLRASPLRTTPPEDQQAVREDQRTGRQAHEAVLEEPGAVHDEQGNDLHSALHEGPMQSTGGDNEHDHWTDSTSPAGMGNPAMEGGTGELASLCSGDGGDNDSHDGQGRPCLAASSSSPSTTTTTSKGRGSSRSGTKPIKKKTRLSRPMTTVGRPLGRDDRDDDNHEGKGADPTIWRFVTTEPKLW